VAAAGNGDAIVAWQDMRRGTGDIRITRTGERVGRSRVVAGGPRGNRWRPALAIAGKRAIVAWEDSRDGPSQVYVRRMPLPRIR
jgi:hypothetical protein